MVPSYTSAAIIMLTDGQRTTGVDPIEAAKLAADRGVKVYTVGTFSKEVCGGPHVANTGDMGRFRILKEESSSAGVRRIKAVLEK